MSTYRVAQVAAAGGPFEIVGREVPRPGPGRIRIAVDACGICHSDAVFVNAMLPGVRFPLVPGHEIAGRIEELGGTSVWVYIGVVDRSRACPELREPCEEDEDGRGLVLVGFLADDWGADVLPWGKRVWAGLHGKKRG